MKLKYYFLKYMYSMEIPRTARILVGTLSGAWMGVYIYNSQEIYTFLPRKTYWRGYGIYAVIGGLTGYGLTKRYCKITH